MRAGGEWRLSARPCRVRWQSPRLSEAAGVSGARRSPLSAATAPGAAASGTTPAMAQAKGPAAKKSSLAPTAPDASSKKRKAGAAASSGQATQASIASMFRPKQ